MSFTVSTKGHYDFVDITRPVGEAVTTSGRKSGVAVVFVSGSTAALTTMEFEEGLKKDLVKILEQWAPEDSDYEHHQKWGDRNGAAHLKSALIGTSVSVPITKGELALGTWQQIVLIDFDERPRQREITVTVLPAS